MKNILSRWILLLLSAIILPACNDSDNPDAPGNPSNSDTPKLSQEILTEGTWQGSLGYRIRFNTLSVTFENDGKGTLKYSEADDYKHEKSFFYIFNYEIHEPYVTCHSITSSHEDVMFEFRDGSLYPLAEKFKMFVLGNEISLRTNSYGTVLNDGNFKGERGLRKIWVHENGLNIIDFRRLPILIKLTKQREKWFKYCRNSDDYNVEDMFYFEYDYPNPGNFIIHNFDAGTVVDCTDDKLVLEDDGKFQIYHPGEPSILPQVTDVDEILSSTTEWICYPYGYHYANYWKMKLYPDGTFICKDYYKGTYTYTDTEITFTLTQIYSDDYIVDLKPETWISPLIIKDINKIEFEWPKGNLCYFEGNYEYDSWKP